jgi:hypothetical protein
MDGLSPSLVANAGASPVRFIDYPLPMTASPPFKGDPMELWPLGLPAVSEVSESGGESVWPLWPSHR